jgi:hypothetical protein
MQWSPSRLQESEDRELRLAASAAETRQVVLAALKRLSLDKVRACPIAGDDGMCIFRVGGDHTLERDGTQEEQNGALGPLGLPPGLECAFAVTNHLLAASWRSPASIISVV